MSPSYSFHAQAADRLATLQIMKPLRAFVVAVALAVAATACDTADPTTTSAAPSVVVQPTVENFTGTVQPGSTDFKSFNVLLSQGTITITLTAAGPPPSLVVGLAVGQVSGSTCALLSNSSVAAQASTVPQLSGQANAGSYCVILSDTRAAAAQTDPITYAVTVTHY
jgi:hypothetical protein